MSTPNPIPQPESPTGMTLDQFMDTYGPEAMDAGEEDPKIAAPAQGPEHRPPAAPSQGPVSPPAGEGEEDEPSSLDAATLKALGLNPEDPPSSSGDTQQQAGTQSQQSVDLAALARTLGVEEDDLSLEDGAVTVTTKVDGEQSRVPFAELRKGYQLQQHFTRQNEEFLRQKQQWEAAQQAREHQANEQLTLASDILNDDEKALKAKFSLDWDELRQEDPVEYAAKAAEYNQKLAVIRDRRQRLMADKQQQDLRARQQSEEFVQRARQEGLQYLSSELGWKTSEDQQKGGTQIRQYLQSTVGLHPQEVDGILDHRVLVLTDKARRYDELMEKVAHIRRKPETAPKVPQGTASKPEGGAQVAYRDAQQRLRKSHSVDDAATLFRHMGIV